MSQREDKFMRDDAQLTIKVGDHEIADGSVLWVVLGWDGTPVDAMRVGPKTHYDAGDDLESWNSASIWGWLAARKYDSMMWLGHS